jgi:hypothetical protein
MLLKNAMWRQLKSRRCHSAPAPNESAWSDAQAAPDGRAPEPLLSEPDRLVPECQEPAP